jgi:ribokinase
VGAGDALIGALAAALDRGAPLREALREGVAAGSLACTREGAQPSLPWRADIARLAATI